MPRLARAELFDPSEIACVHVMARTNRRCFLLGTDHLTGKNYDHRKQWIEDRLKLLAANFGIDLLCFSLMSNHCHQVLRSRPDVVATWDDTEVARRWLTICPPRKVKKYVDGKMHLLPVEPTEFDLNSIRHDPIRLEKIRSRLSDISWWMRLLCQVIAMRANSEEGPELGKFWQSRFKAVRLLDEETILACAAYVDLNPIRAAIAETLEGSDYTSVQRRIESLKASSIDSANETQHDATLPDAFLAPVKIDELHDPIGPNASVSGSRCSDKGFTWISTVEYIELLDWIARSRVAGKRGCTPQSAPAVFERLDINAAEWLIVVNDFGRLFSNVAGKPQNIKNARSRVTHRKFLLRRRASALSLSA